LIRPCVQFKSVERDALRADGDLRDAASDLGIEAVSVHAQVVRRIPEADESGKQSECAVVLRHLLLFRAAAPGTLPSCFFA
jgi:hypothetical protein